MIVCHVINYVNKQEAFLCKLDGLIVFVITRGQCCCSAGGARQVSVFRRSAAAALTDSGSSNALLRAACVRWRWWWWWWTRWTRFWMRWRWRVWTASVFRPSGCGCGVDSPSSGWIWIRSVSSSSGPAWAEPTRSASTCCRRTGEPLPYTTGTHIYCSKHCSAVKSV